MIYIIGGHPHDGKTLFFTLTGIHALDAGKQVFANFHINYKSPNGNTAQFIDIGKLIGWVQQEGHHLESDSGLLLLDEAYKGFDSYKSRSTANLIFSYFILQARKYGFRDVYFNAQIFKSLHNRIRGNIDFAIRAWRLPNAKNDYTEPHFEYYIQATHDGSITPFTISNKWYMQIRQYYDHEEEVKKPMISLDSKLAKDLEKQLDKMEIERWKHEDRQGEVDPSRIRVKKVR